MRSPVEAFDSGSNYSFGDKLQRANNPRSAFDLSHLITTTIENCGHVQVLDVIETLPGDDHEINIKSLIRCLPQVVPLYSRQRIYIYVFWSRYSDLWSEWNTFMTKGYDGKTVLTTPVYDRTKNLVVEEDEVVKPGSLADGFGIQQGISAEMLEGLNAFDAMQLLRIFRDYFLNKNFYVEDRVILPNDDSRFRLGTDGRLLSAVDEGVDFKFELCSDDYSGYVVDPDTGARTFSQFNHDWPQDYFTSGLPWPQRGEAATLDVNITAGTRFGSIGFDDGSTRHLLDVYKKTDGINYYITPNNTSDILGFGTLNSSSDFSQENAKLHQISGQPAYNGNKIVVTGTTSSLSEALRMGRLAAYTSDETAGSVSFTLNQLRELAVNQTELERMAHTDGSYAEFGLTFFSERSKNAIDYKPIYVGGCYENIQYTEVLQTSAQYAESSGSYVPVGSPLGTYGGHGIGSANGYIGRLHCDDYGQIMVLACIMPDVYYNTGCERRLTNRYQSDFFLPERAKLGLRPTLKKEIFMSGTSEDDDLFNYQNVFDEYRYLPNRIKGKIANKDFKSFYPYTQSRDIEETPEFNAGFVEANNVRKDYLQAPSEVAFTAQFKIQDRCVRALPYKGIPADILN